MPKKIFILHRRTMRMGINIDIGFIDTIVDVFETRKGAEDSMNKTKPSFFSSQIEHIEERELKP